MSQVSRSTALTVVALAGLAGSVLTSATASADPGDRREVRNVIYLLGDGMGRTHVTAGRERYYGADGRMVMETLPRQGFVSTFSVERRSGQPGSADFAPNLVTDSASAATAWASGVKTYNAALGVDAKGAVVPTVMELAKSAGYRTGNVSTAEITDATPAGQMSHVLARGCQGPAYSDASCQDLAVTGTALPTDDVRVTPVAKQIARNGTADVILGGGASRFDGADGAALRAQGYTVLGPQGGAPGVARRTDLQRASGAKVFGLFSSGNLTVEKFKRDHPASAQAQEPTLPEMTAKAIDLLQRRRGGEGFYLQVEGALIDKRSHANDAAQTLGEQKAFDDAVKVAYDFARRDRHTLVIVTADHECAGFNIIEKGTATNAESDIPGTGNRDAGNPANNSANNGLADRLRQSTLPSRSVGIQNAPGGTPPVEGGTAANNFAPATFRTPDDPAGIADGTPEASLWLSYLSGNHTGADVPVYGYGPGSAAVAGSIDDTDLFDIVGSALGVTR